MSEQQPPSRAAEIIDILKLNVLEGRLALDIACRLLEARGTGRLPQDQWLYYGIGIFCWREALMSLSRLLDRSSDAITVPYLLGYSEGNPSEYPLAAPGEVLQVVTRQRDVLATNPLWATIRRLRDTTFDERQLEVPGDDN